MWGLNRGASVDRYNALSTTPPSALHKQRPGSVPPGPPGAHTQSVV